MNKEIDEMETFFQTELKKNINKNSDIKNNPFNFNNKSIKENKCFEKDDLLDDFFNEKFGINDDVIKQYYTEYLNNFKNKRDNDDENPEKYISFKNWIVFHPPSLEKKDKSNNVAKEYYSINKNDFNKINIFNIFDCFLITKYSSIQQFFTKEYLEYNTIYNILENYRNIFIDKDRYTELLNFYNNNKKLFNGVICLKCSGFNKENKILFKYFQRIDCVLNHLKEKEHSSMIFNLKLSDDWVQIALEKRKDDLIYDLIESQKRTFYIMNYEDLLEEDKKYLTQF
jgi:hypothetical protein